MKKSDFYSYIVYLIILVGVILLGLFVVSPGIDAFNESSGASYGNGMAASIVSFIVTIIVLPLGYELLHLLGAKAGGYEVVSVNVLFFNVYKNQSNKWKFRFKSFDGLTGETIANPKEGKEKYSPKIMLTLPNVFLALSLILFLFIYLILPKDNVYKISLLISSIVAGILLVYNFLPVPLDCKTDGYSLRLVAKKQDVEAYNELLRLKSCEVLGKDPGDIKVFEKVTDLSSEINLLTIYKYLGEEKYENALKVIDISLKNTETLSNKIEIRLIAQKLFIYIFLNRMDEAKSYYSTISQDQKRDISNDLSMESIRAYILISAALDLSESEVQYATSRVDSAYKKAEEGRKEIEKRLYKETLEFVKKLHPKWNLVITNNKE